MDAHTFPQLLYLFPQLLYLPEIVPVVQNILTRFCSFPFFLF